MAEAAQAGAEAGVVSGAPTEAGALTPPLLHRVSTTPEVVPFAAHVLIVGNATRTLSNLAGALHVIGVTSRATLAAEDIFGMRARELPELLLIDDDAAVVSPLEFIQRINANPRLCDIPIVMISSNTDVPAKVEAFSAGVVDYVCVPVAVDELAARVVAHVRLRRAQLESEQHSRKLEAFVLEQVSEITDSQMATIIALARLAESRDDQTGGHLERVQKYCRMLAEKMSEQMRFGIIDHTFIDNIEYASALHDIGKVAISDLILLKPAELSDAEFELMKSHTMLGAETLEAVSGEYPNNDFIAMGIKIARWHHERWDGSGYPDGLVGEAIPLAARIMAVADVYDALMSERSYKLSFSHTRSREIIVAQSGSHFDPAVVEAFLELEEEFRGVTPE
jgi:putative two-component system response regulator